MNVQSEIRTIEFATAAVEPRYRADAFRDALPFALSTLEPANQGGVELSSSIKCWSFGGVTIGKGYSSPFSATRAKSKLVENRVIDITKCFPGHRRFGQDGHCYEVQPGGISLLDGSRWQNVTLTGPIESVFANVDHDLIGFEPAKAPGLDALARGLESPAHEIIDANLDLLVQHLPNADMGQAATLTSVFAGILRALLSSQRPDDFSYQMLQEGGSVAVQRYVDRHFGRFDLSVDQVCHACGMSRATLYRAFARHGGFARYVTHKRLAAAHEELSRSVPRRGLIREVAERWGFTNQAHFARLFRQRIGVSPSDIVGTAITVQRSGLSD